MIEGGFLSITRRTQCLLILILVAGITAVTFLSASPAQKSAKQVYLDKCSVCHGEDGRGRTARGKKLKVKDIAASEIRRMTDDQLLQVVLKGKGQNMDGFEKELGPDTSKKLVAYMRSLTK